MLLAEYINTEQGPNIVFEPHEEVMHLPQGPVSEAAKTKSHQLWHCITKKLIYRPLDESNDSIVRINDLARLLQNDDVNWKRLKSDDVHDVLPNVLCKRH